MPANAWMGGAEIRDHRKQRERKREGNKKGRADSYFSTVATRVGCNPNLIVTTHIVNSHSQSHTDQDRSPANPHQRILLIRLSVCHTTCVFSRCGLPFLVLALALVLRSADWRFRSRRQSTPGVFSQHQRTWRTSSSSTTDDDTPGNAVKTEERGRRRKCRQVVG